MSPDGGIGRRAGLKHQWGNPSRFEPGSGYKGSNAEGCANNTSFFIQINYYKRMKILMIGGTGTISSAITRQLAESGHDLWLLNRGHRKNEVPENV